MEISRIKQQSDEAFQVIANSQKRMQAMTEKFVKLAVTDKVSGGKNINTGSHVDFSA